jgi:hypothetical protein
MSEFSLDRQQNIANNIDASGKKWEVLHKRGTAMYLARPVPDRKDAQIPARFAGFWTKAQLCQDQIRMHCEQSFQEADRIAAKNRPISRGDDCRGRRTGDGRGTACT